MGGKSGKGVFQEGCGRPGKKWRLQERGQAKCQNWGKLIAEEAGRSLLRNVRVVMVKGGEKCRLADSGHPHNHPRNSLTTATGYARSRRRVPGKCELSGTLGLLTSLVRVLCC